MQTSDPRPVEATHASLVHRAARWLTTTKRCAVVLAEAISWGISEQPDAIGWTGRGDSILVECKVSRTDFTADQRKPFAANRLGVLRYYMTPPGLLHPNDLPDGWGLLWAGGRVSVKREATPATDANLHGEVSHLVAEFRRVLTGIRDPRKHRTGIQLDPPLADSLDAYRRWALNERAKELRALKLARDLSPPVEP